MISFKFTENKINKCKFPKVMDDILIIILSTFLDNVFYIYAVFIF